jgi:hypothetical protein
MGLVEIHGKAKGEQLTPSPVTKTPCLFYKVDIEKWVKDKSGGHWSHAKTDADGVKFYLEDTTGKVLVDAHGAEYDLIQTGRRQIGGGLKVDWRGLLGRSKKLSVPAGPQATDGELFNYVESVLGGTRGKFSLDGGSVLRGLLGGGISFGSGSGTYRLTEYCILPEHWYDLTGTCVENPNPQDEHDRNMIVKGQNEPTFLISWRGEKALESTLRKRAALHIFGGAALAVVCLAIVLFRLGWL